MTPSIHWLTDHSPITHTDPQDPPNPPRTHLTWPFLHFMTFYTIQTKYFRKPHHTQYPLTHWPLTHYPHRPTRPTKPTHLTVWPSESRTVVHHLVWSVVFLTQFCNEFYRSAAKDIQSLVILILWATILNNSLLSTYQRSAWLFFLFNTGNLSHSIDRVEDYNVCLKSRRRKFSFSNVSCFYLRYIAAHI